MASQLAALAAESDPTVRASQYASFLQQAVASNNHDLLLAFADHFTDEAAAQSVAHGLFAEFNKIIPSLNPELHKELSLHVLSAVSQRVHSFEAEVIEMRVALAKVFEDELDWPQAARTLADIPFDGVASSLTHSFVLEQNVKIARFYIEDDDPVSADQYCARATRDIGHCTNEEVRLMHRVSVARLLDSKRKFEDAAMKYYQLSQMAHGSYGTAVVGVTETSQALNYAITCSILAPAGPRRSRLLAMLYNDERSRDLAVYPMLESIHMGRLLKQAQVDAFRPTLRPHQVATDGEGITVLDRAVTEHNLLAASQLYTNIRFEELGAVLGVSARKAEDVCQLMAYEGRMQASLDQVMGVVEFETPGTRRELLRWDAQIENICASVDGCCDAILKAYPQLSTNSRF